MRWFALVGLVAALAAAPPVKQSPATYNFRLSVDLAHVADNPKFTALKLVSYAVACIVSADQYTASVSEIQSRIRRTRSDPYAAAGIATTQFYPLSVTNAAAYELRVPPPADAEQKPPVYWHCAVLFGTNVGGVVTHLDPRGWQTAQFDFGGTLPTQ